jgi:Flp pilus assembly protein TadB
MHDRLRPYDRRQPTKFEMAFSLGIIVIVAILGLLILTGAFTIGPEYRVTLGLILIAYSLVRFWMLKSRYRSFRRKEESPNALPKEQGENLRKL